MPSIKILQVVHADMAKQRLMTSGMLNQELPHGGPKLAPMVEIPFPGDWQLSQMTGPLLHANRIEDRLTIAAMKRVRFFVVKLMPLMELTL